MPILSSLKVLRGSTKKNKRVGRGPGSGHGKTSTRGHKGKKARTHGVVQRGFEGGQMPLHRRLPKFGFTNVFRVEYTVVNLDDLNRFSKEVGPDALMEAGLAKSGMPIKILGTGKLDKAVSVTAHAFSEAAKAAIEKAGGSINLVVKKSKPYVRAEKTK